MHVLIVEDNAFNAFCLTRLLQASCQHIKVSVVDNSAKAYNFFLEQTPSFVILDGCLSARDRLNAHGPILADLIWTAWPKMPVIAWTNCDTMRQTFNDVFKKHKKSFNEIYCWSKVVSQTCISNSLACIRANSLICCPREDGNPFLH